MRCRSFWLHWSLEQIHSKSEKKCKLRAQPAVDSSTENGPSHQRAATAHAEVALGRRIVPELKALQLGQMKYRSMWSSVTTSWISSGPKPHLGHGTFVVGSLAILIAASIQPARFILGAARRISLRKAIDLCDPIGNSTVSLSNRLPSSKGYFIKHRWQLENLVGDGFKRHF